MSTSSPVVRRVTIPLSGFAAGPRATVLVVSDDAGLRAATGRVLDQHGFMVLEASHAGHALLRCLQHAWPVDVLLIDAVMPDGSGRAAAQRLEKTRPEMRTLFLGEHGAAPGDDTIPRPFNADDLLTAIERVLGSRGTSL